MVIATYEIDQRNREEMMEEFEGGEEYLIISFSLFVYNRKVIRDMCTINGFVVCGFYWEVLWRDPSIVLLVRLYNLFILVHFLLLESVHIPVVIFWSEIRVCFLLCHW